MNISRLYLAVIFTKHGPNEMFRFFHGEIFKVNGLPLYFKPINLYNIDVGNIIQKHLTFKPKKIKHYSPQIIFLQQIFEALMQTTRKPCVDLMQGGVNIFTILPSGHSKTSIFFFNQLQIDFPHSIELCVTSTVAQFLPSTFLRHFCKENQSLVPLICMRCSFRFMNCCKSFQNRHWPH